jgi:hypothetical protein
MNRLGIGVVNVSKMSKKEQVLEILDNLDYYSKMPSERILECNLNVYGDLLDAMLNEGLISGEKPKRNEYNNDIVKNDFEYNLDTYKMSIRGMDYLEQNRKKE